ncbi:membrane-bound alpha-1,6- mannosyltransferase Initiation-specific [Orbilia oligospora]|nr:membrane-bound alpha-1,6- mannosyltransferase Initiation-specific [Orbilia oligospora]
MLCPRVGAPRRQFIIVLNALILFVFLYHLPHTIGPFSPQIYSIIPKSPLQQFYEEPEKSGLITKEIQSHLLSQARKLSSVEFPRHIYQTWKTEKLPEANYDRQKSWFNNNPSYEYTLFTDITALQYVTKNFNTTDPYIVHLYKNFPQRILAADLLRYLIAYTSGGLYVDLDTICTAPVDQWMPRSIGYQQNIKMEDINLVVGLELDALNTTKYPDKWIAKNKFSKRIQFLQWSIYAKPGHEVLRRMISSIQETAHKDVSDIVWRRKDVSSLRYNQIKILDTTGPFRWTKIIMEYINQIEGREVGLLEYSGIKEAKKIGDVLFLPVNRWSPGVNHSDAGGVETSFLVHYYGATWKKNLP